MAIAWHNAGTATGTTTSLTINVPSGTLTGDLLIASVHAENNASNAAFTWPAGWTVVDTVAGTNAQDGEVSRMEVAIADYTGQASVQVTGLVATLGSNVGVMSSYGGVLAAASGSSFAAHSMSTFTSGGAPGITGTALTTPSVTSGAGGLWRVAIFFCSEDSTTTTWSSLTSGNTSRASASGSANLDRAAIALVDSNGVATAGGGTTCSYTPSGTYYTAASWIGLMYPAPPGLLVGQSVNRATSY